MALTKHDLNQIDKLLDKKLDEKLDSKLSKAFDDFFNDKLLPVLSQFVTKQEFYAEIDPMKEDIRDLKQDVNELKNGFVRLENKLDREALRNQDAHAYLENQVNVVRTHAGLTALPPLFSPGS